MHPPQKTKMLKELLIGICTKFSGKKNNKNKQKTKSTKHKQRLVCTLFCQPYICDDTLIIIKPGDNNICKL